MSFRHLSGFLVAAQMVLQRAKMDVGERLTCEALAKLNPKAKVVILSGKLHSISAQFPREIGRIAAEKACEHLAVKPVAKDIVVPVKLITRENAATILEAK